jgi:O-antigen ligase
MDSHYNSDKLFNLTSVMATICIALGTGYLTGHGLGIIIIAAAGALSVMMIAIRKPDWLLFLCILIGPVLTLFSFTLAHSIPEATFPRVIFLFLIVGIIYTAIAHPNEKLGLIGMDVFIIFFCLTFLITTYIRSDTEQFKKLTLSFADAFIIPFFLYYCSRIFLWSPKQFKRLAWFCLIAGVIISAMGIYENITQIDLLAATKVDEVAIYNRGLRTYEGAISRSNGPFQNPEPYGITLSLLFFMASYLISPSENGKTTSNFKKIIISAALLIIFYGTWVSHFRMIVLSIVLGICLRAVFFKKMVIKILISGAIGLAIMSVTWGIISSTNLYKDRLSDAGTGYARIATWILTLHMVSEYSLLGTGFYGYEEAQQRYPYPVTYRGEENAPHPHNAFLAVLIEGGVIGLATYIGMLFFLFKYNLKFPKFVKEEDSNNIAAVIIGVNCAYFFPMFTLTTHYDPSINMVYFIIMGSFIGRLNRTLLNP